MAYPPSGWAKFWAGLALFVLVLLLSNIASVAGVLIAHVSHLDFNTALAITEVFGGLLAFASVAILGGWRAIRPSAEGMATVWKSAAYLLILSGLMMMLQAGSVLLGYETLDIAGDWPKRILVVVALCIGVGMYEEGLLRGLLLNALLVRFGRSLAGVYVAVLLSSFVFGMMHWDWFIDFSDPVQLGQNCLKVLQTGIVGYLLAAIYVKTRNLWGVALVHAANDFILMFIELGLTETNLDTAYVAQGGDGAMYLGLYAVMCVLYLPLVVIGTKLINRTGAWRGAFWTYDDAAPLPPVAAPVAAPVYPAGYVAPPTLGSQSVPAAAPQYGQHAAPPAAPPQPVQYPRQGDVDGNV